LEAVVVLGAVIETRTEPNTTSQIAKTIVYNRYSNGSNTDRNSDQAKETKRQRDRGDVKNRKPYWLQSEQNLIVSVQDKPESAVPRIPAVEGVLDSDLMFSLSPSWHTRSLVSGDIVAKAKLRMRSRLTTINGAGNGNMRIRELEESSSKPWSAAHCHQQAAFLVGTADGHGALLSIDNQGWWFQENTTERGISSYEEPTVIPDPKLL
ncbi:hypothetical protein E4U43_003371, partial [Claviceps pusilla]